ncbi:hypothetical protein B0H14DRAFT_3737111 [Mycena olivaceomarginata]|nr:hypothetical protein B0H14DRAFT_3737111 [Mycena olivaceomarginata]
MQVENMRKPPIIANHNGPPNPTAGREKIPGAASLRTPLSWCRRSSGHKHPEPRLRWEVHHMILHLGDVRIIPLGRCTLHSGWARVQALLLRGGQVVPLFLPIAAPRLQGSIIYTPLQPPTFSSYIPGPWQAQNVRGKINPNHVTRKEIQVRNEEKKKLAGMGGKDRPYIPTRRQWTPCCAGGKQRGPRHQSEAQSPGEREQSTGIVEEGPPAVTKARGKGQVTRVRRRLQVQGNRVPGSPRKDGSGWDARENERNARGWRQRNTMEESFTGKVPSQPAPAEYPHAWTRRRALANEVGRVSRGGPVSANTEQVAYASKDAAESSKLEVARVGSAITRYEAAARGRANSVSVTRQQRRRRNERERESVAWIDCATSIHGGHGVSGIQKDARPRRAIGLSSRTAAHQGIAGTPAPRRCLLTQWRIWTSSKATARRAAAQWTKNTGKPRTRLSSVKGEGVTGYLLSLRRMSEQEGAAGRAAYKQARGGSDMEVLAPDELLQWARPDGCARRNVREGVHREDAETHPVGDVLRGEKTLEHAAKSVDGERSLRAWSGTAWRQLGGRVSEVLRAPGSAGLARVDS